MPPAQPRSTKLLCLLSLPAPKAATAPAAAPLVCHCKFWQFHQPKLLPPLALQEQGPRRHLPCGTALKEAP